LVGSSNNVPARPFAANVFTLPLKSSVPLPETSTVPPLPDAAPPCALIVP
jgi:hypothetical protein